MPRLSRSAPRAIASWRVLPPWILLFLLAGCGGQEEVTIHESWDEIYMGDVKAGYAHTKVTRDAQSTERELWQVASEMKLYVLREGKRADMTVRHHSTETPEGELVRFETTNELGGSPQTVRGRVEGQTLHLESTGGQNARNWTIPWSADTRTLFHVIHSLEKQPLAADQSRVVRQFDPVFSQQVFEVRMRGLQEESTDVLDGKADLLRVAMTESAPGVGTILRVLWVDQQGRVAKTWVPSHRQTTYRSSRLEAVKEPAGKLYDIYEATRVVLDRKLDRAHSTRRVVYRVTLRDRNPAELFSMGPTQSFRSADERSGLLTVRAIRPATPGIAAEARPADADLRSNLIIQSDDERVQAMARQAAPNETDPWKIAVALERHVKASMKQADTAQALVSAAEVAQSLEGDCTEYAVLLAALARARGIPARAAVGLVYDSKDSFAFHMWTEVYVADRWVPLDATFGNGGIGAAHLKLTDTNFAAEQGLVSYWRVSETMGQFVKLEVVEVE